METKKDILNFCNAARFCDYKELDNIEELNKVRKCIINSFQEKIMVSGILVVLLIRGDMILKNNENDTGDIVINLHDSGELFLYMIVFEKIVKEETN